MSTDDHSQDSSGAESNYSVLRLGLQHFWKHTALPAAQQLYDTLVGNHTLTPANEMARVQRQIQQIEAMNTELVIPPLPSP